MSKCQLRAGAGNEIISFPNEFFPQEGFSGIHDDIHARVLILDSNIKVILVSLELTSMPVAETDTIKEIINSLISIPKENIWICVTHSFSSPHFMPSEAIKQDVEKRKMEMLHHGIQEAVKSATEKAILNLQDACIGNQKGVCDVNVNRDVLTRDGWWIGSNPEGNSDKTLSVIRVDKKVKTKENQAIAIVFNYNVQSSIMDGVMEGDGTKKITSDLAGKASCVIEEYYGENTTAMFLIGAAGDQAPQKKAKRIEADQRGAMQEHDFKEEGYMFIEELGEKLGRQTIDIAEKIICGEDACIKNGKVNFICPGQIMPKNIHDLRPTFSYEYIEDEDRDMSVEVIRIGDMVLIGTKPELGDVTASQIKNISEYADTLIVTMVNGASKYMADSESYEKNTYEARNSLFGKGAAEILVQNTITLLKQIKE